MKVGDLVKYKYQPLRYGADFVYDAIGIVVSCSENERLVESTRTKGVYHPVPESCEVSWVFPDGLYTLRHASTNLILISSCKDDK